MRSVDRATAPDIVIQKFGGSSLATFADIRRVGDIIRTAYQSGRPVVAVVSARGHTTDDLIAVAGEFGAAASAPSLGNAREVDQLLATGEIASAALCAIALREQGVPAVSLDGRQAGITVTGPPGHGVIAEIDTARITRLLSAGNVVVVAGFQGVNSDGDITTLGRGGSDTTAVALAAALGQHRCHIYTDVDGVCTADPRIVPLARPLATVDADVLAEMAIAGAAVVHPRAAELAATCRVDLQVSNSFTPSAGTVVRSRTPDSMATEGGVVAITDDRSVAQVRVHHRPTNPHRDLFTALASHAVSLELVGQVDDGMTFAIPRDDLAAVRALLTTDGTVSPAEIEVDDTVGKVSLVGRGLLSNTGYVSRTLATLAELGIPASPLSSSPLRISVLVPANQVAVAVKALHQEFRLSTGDRDFESIVSA